MRKLSIETRCVLLAFLDRQDEMETYGFALSQTTGLPSGSIYPILRRLEDRKWIASRWETIDESHEGRRRRRYYRLTKKGLHLAQHAVAAEAAALRQLISVRRSESS
jgi:PadR family transcriptional regulator, regulatory protein PadR